MEKRLVGLLFATLIFGVSLKAQTIGKKHLERIILQVEEMTTVMKLDDGQKTKVLELKKEQALKHIDIAQKLDKGSQEFKTAKKEANSDFSSKLKKICTKEQLKNWTTHKRAQKSKK